MIHEHPCWSLASSRRPSWSIASTWLCSCASPWPGPHDPRLLENIMGSNLQQKLAKPDHAYVTKR